MNYYEEIVKENMDEFLNCFSDAFRYVKFRTLMENLAKQADEGDEGSIEIINRVGQVANLIKYSLQK